MSDRVNFVCDGAPVSVAVAEGETLLSVLRERLRIVSVKDGCAPQGQCGCCTVLVEGQPRVACVTPAMRVEGRAVTTVDGLDASTRGALVEAFVACGGSQCGFCTPGILVRAAHLIDTGRTARADIDRALGAHLCRCTGWQPIVESITRAASMLAGEAVPEVPDRLFSRASRRAELEGDAEQHVGHDVPLGGAGFADDTAPRDALVFVPRPFGSEVEAVMARGRAWVDGETLHEARSRAGKVQGRRTTRDDGPPLEAPVAPPGGVALATSWVEPAYLEPDASWCEPGGGSASPLANGGAFGGKDEDLAGECAAELSRALGRTARVVYAREDVARRSYKRPPIAATAVYDDGRLLIEGRVARAGSAAFVALPSAYRCVIDGRWQHVAVEGPPTAEHVRGFPVAEQAVLVEGALAEAGVNRADLVTDRCAALLLDSVVEAPTGARAGARVQIDPGTGRLAAVTVRVACGDPLDEVVLRSYACGAVHMALGWVLSEGLAVDRETGEVLGLTIRSFGIIRARDLPPITVEIVDEPGPPIARASDAVFAATAAAAWNAVTAVEGRRPVVFPARETRTGRTLRRSS